jgi:hypothetical protein
MKNTDRFTIFKKSTELLDKMDLGMADQRSKGISLEVSLETMYVKTKQELISHIKKQVAQIESITELTDCLTDSCYSFAGLGMRQDLLRIKLTGASKNGQEAMCDAIIKDTKPETSIGLDWLACDHSEQSLTQEARNLCQEAFDNNCFSLYPENTNDKALAFIYFIDRLRGYNCNLDLTPVALDFQYFSCLKVILGKNWATRPLVGYFDDGGDYVMQGTDSDFIGIYANKLRELLSQAGVKRCEHFQSLQIKRYVEEQIIQAYAGNNSTRPLLVYAEIERLIAARDKGITAEDYEDATYSNGFAITKRYDTSGMTYEINTEGLQALADLLESLELNELQEINVIIDKIKTACA